MPPLMIYALALGVGVGLALLVWRLALASARRPRPASVNLDDPALICRLKAPPELARLHERRTLWLAEGPTHDRSALIYPYGDLGLLLELDHPEEQVVTAVQRLLATTRADYVLLHVTRYRPIGVALRPSPKRARLQRAKEQLAKLVERAGLQAIWVPFGHNSDIDDIVIAIMGGALAPATATDDATEAIP